MRVLMAKKETQRATRCVCVAKLRGLDECIVNTFGGVVPLNTSNKI